MGKFVSIAALVVMGLIVADIVTHPVGASSAGSALKGLETPVVTGLVGR